MMPTNPETDYAPTLALDGDPLDWPLEERPRIYVAGYFSANPMHGTANAARWFQPLLDAGWLPVIPHMSLLLDVLCPQTPEFWYAYDLSELDTCTALFVCPDCRTRESAGVNREVRRARRNNMPVFDSIVPAKERYQR